MYYRYICIDTDRMKVPKQMSKVKWINRIGRYLAFGSFGIGSLILITHILMHYISNGELFVFGYIYLMAALLINSIYLLFLIACIALFKENRKGLFETGALLLFNIPIAALYAYIAFMFI